MKAFSVKKYLQLDMPAEDIPVSDQARITTALNALGYEPVTMPLRVLRTLYPLCRDPRSGITVSLVHRGSDWVVTRVEAGDQRHLNYGLAVDYGSTTVIMQLIDMDTGSIIGEERAVNGQVRYGTDILTRITYSMEGPDRVQSLQKATADTFQDLLDRLSEQTGIDASGCSLMTVSGNTAIALIQNVIEPDIILPPGSIIGLCDALKRQTEVGKDIPDLDILKHLSHPS